MHAWYPLHLSSNIHSWLSGLSMASNHMPGVMVVRPATAPSYPHFFAQSHQSASHAMLMCKKEESIFQEWGSAKYCRKYLMAGRFARGRSANRSTPYHNNIALPKRFVAAFSILPD